MKPSTKKETQRDFYLKYKKNIEEMKDIYYDGLKYEFESLIYSGDYLIGVADCVIIISQKDCLCYMFDNDILIKPEDAEKYYSRIIIVEFKDNVKEIMNAIRQLKIYGNAIRKKYPKYVIHLEFCTLEGQLRSDDIELLQNEGIGWKQIPR